jgi:hypothetical protein
MTAEEYRVYKHRFKLSPADKAECALLDANLPELKQRAVTATSREKALADVELYKARKHFNDLTC